MDDRVAGVGWARTRKVENEDLDFESGDSTTVTLCCGENEQLLGLGEKQFGLQLPQLSVQEQGNSEEGRATEMEGMATQGRQVCKFCWWIGPR